MTRWKISVIFDITMQRARERVRGTLKCIVKYRNVAGLVDFHSFGQIYDIGRKILGHRVVLSYVQNVSKIIRNNFYLGFFESFVYKDFRTEC